MKAVYIGLGTLFGEKYEFRGEFHKAFFKKTRKDEKQRGLEEGTLNSIDRLFRELQKDGVADVEQIFKPTTSGWKRPDGTMIRSLEDELIRQARTLPDGSHFFGLSVHGAWHSLILRIQKTATETTVFWMDQFADGYGDVRAGGFVPSPDVTGTLDEQLREIGSGSTSAWRLRPEAAPTE